MDRWLLLLNNAGGRIINAMARTETCIQPDEENIRESVAWEMTRNGYERRDKYRPDWSR